MDDEEDLELMYLTRLRETEVQRPGSYRLEGDQGMMMFGGEEFEDWHVREEAEGLIEGYVQVRKGPLRGD